MPVRAAPNRTDRPERRQALLAAVADTIGPDTIGRDPITRSTLAAAGPAAERSSGAWARRRSSVLPLCRS